MKTNIIIAFLFTGLAFSASFVFSTNQRNSETLHSHYMKGVYGADIGCFEWVDENACDKGDDFETRDPCFGGWYDKLPPGAVVPDACPSPSVTIYTNQDPWDAFRGILFGNAENNQVVKPVADVLCTREATCKESPASPLKSHLLDTQWINGKQVRYCRQFDTHPDWFCKACVQDSIKDGVKVKSQRCQAP